jgi:tRNA A-37 threonylcarbamoyl transferase component Bud32
MTPPEDLTGYATGAEAARPAAPEDLTSLPTGMEAAGDTRGGLSSSAAGNMAAADFEIVRELGSGGMGTVHLARHRRVRTRWFAIKTLRADKTADAGFLKRFYREAEVLYGLRHTHIVVLHGASRQGEAPMMVLEYIPGPRPADPGTHPGWAPDWPSPPLNLQDFVNREGALPPHRVADIGAKLASALQAVHDRGLVHRDVKPQNVLIDSSSDPVLADFGLARDIDPASLRLTGSMDNLGTIGYVAPEVKRDPAAATPAADQFSLAVTLYAVATGDDPDVIRPESVAPWLFAVLSRALNKNPDERYPSAAAFGEALSKFRPAVAAATGFDPSVATCPHCGSPNKDTDLLCAQCGKGLTSPCLKCNQPTPVSRRACVKCGAVQPEVFDAIKKDAEGRFATAAKARQDLRFKAAMEAMEPLTALTHPRLIDFANRAKNEIKTAQAEWAVWQKKIESAVGSAWPDFAAGRFAGVAGRFAPIPPVLWTPRMTLLAAEAREGQVQQSQATTALSALLTAHAHPHAPVNAEATADKFELYRLFKRYAQRIRHHSYEDLHTEMAVEGAWAHFSRFAVLTSVYESREVTPHLRPHANEPVPPRTPPSVELDPWGVRLPIPEVTSNVTVEHPIPQTQRVISCDPCKMTGSVVCGECSGTKMMSCRGCSGTKMVGCSACKGKGREERTRKVRKYRDCPRCRGSGRIENYRCNDCDGTGRAEYRGDEVYTVPCAVCTERGKVPCETCRATGEVLCQVCRATGAVTCPTCQGRQRLVEVKVVKQTLWPVAQTTAPTRPGSMPAEVFQQLRPDRDYARVGQLVSRDLAPFGADFALAEQSELAEQVRGLLSAAQQANPGARLARQQVVVHAAQAYQFAYELEKKQYDCWVAGAAAEVYAPVNPITDELEQMVREAIEDDRPRAAAMAVRDAREMAQDDDFCAAALDRVKDDVPDDTWAWSKTVWSEEKRNTVTIGVGIAGVGLLLMLISLLTQHISFGLIGFLVAAVGGGIATYGKSKPR